MIFFFLILGFTGMAADVGGDVLFELSKPGVDWALSGVELALSSSHTNPAGLAFRRDWELVSTYLSPLSVGHFGTLALAGPFVAVQAFLFYAGNIGPELSYRAEGAAFSLGVALGPLGLGCRVRLFRPVLPEKGLGFSVDTGLIWRGASTLGVLLESVWAQAPFPGETWPWDVSFALAAPVKLPRITLFLGVAARDLLTVPVFSSALGFELSGFTIVGSVSTTGFAVGGSVSWSWLRLEWVFSTHPHLPGSFCVSLAWRWP